MNLYRDTGVVLRAQKLGEADRIITVLTQEHGRVRAVARGVRRTTSRWGARVEPLMVIDLQMYRRPQLDVITQVETHVPYGALLTADYPKYTAGMAIAEMAERLTPEEQEPAPVLFRLMVGALRALYEGHYDSGLVLDAFLLRAMAMAGWALCCEGCAVCGSPGSHRGFSVQAGGQVCPECRPPGSTAPAPDTVALLAALLSGDWSTAMASDARARHEASGLVAAFVQWQLEKGIRSLRWVERT